MGTAYAIAGGLDAQTALALAVPIGILGTIVWYLRMTFDSVFVHMVDRFIEKEQYNKIWLGNVGMVVAMEEQKAMGEDIPPEFITNIKTSLMGPISGSVMMFW